MLMPTAASGPARDSRMPVSEKLSGSRIARQRKPRFASKEGGTASSWHTTDSSPGVRVIETNVEESAHEGTAASGSKRAIANISERRSSSSSRDDDEAMTVSVVLPNS